MVFWLLNHVVYLKVSDRILIIGSCLVKLSTLVRDHPFKTSAHLRGGGVKNWPNLPTDSSKKLPTEGG